MKLEENHGLDDAYLVSNIKGIIITSQSYICFLLSIRPATEEKYSCRILQMLFPVFS
jgi:hypothetical protein